MARKLEVFDIIFSKHDTHSFLVTIYYTDKTKLNNFLKHIRSHSDFSDGYYLKAKSVKIKSILVPVRYKNNLEKRIKEYKETDISEVIR